MTPSRRSGALVIALAFAIWSTWGLATRWIGVAPGPFSFWLSVAAGLASGSFWLIRGGGWRPLLFPKRFWPLLFLGLFLLGNNFAFFYAFSRTTVANAVFSHYLAPALVALGAPLLLGERRLKSALPAVVVSAVGLFLLLPGVGEGGWEHAAGIGAGAASAFFYAAMLLISRRYVEEIDLLLILFFPNVVVALAAFPAALGAPLPSAGQFGGIALLGLFHATSVPALYLQGLRRTSAQLASILGYIEPLGGALLAALFLGEGVGLWGALGGALILGGGFAVAREEGRQPESR